MAYSENGYYRSERSDRYGDYERGRGGYRDDRGGFERAGDEVRSWFGDDRAEYRRRMDERADPDTNHFRTDDRSGRRRTRARSYGDPNDYRSERSYERERGYGRGDAGDFGGWRRAGGNDYGEGYDRDYDERHGFAAGDRYRTGQDRDYRGHEDEYFSSPGTAYRGASTRAGSHRGRGDYDRYDDERDLEHMRLSRRGRGPKNYTRSKEHIHDEVCRTLTDDHYVDASDIEVKCEDKGEVTLNGHVDSRYEKRLAEDRAHDITGVRHVQNNLRIREHDEYGAASSTPATASSTTTTSGKKSKAH